MKVYILTLGCAKNQVDSETIEKIIRREKYSVTEIPESADIVIVNTCGFIDAAKEESIDYILEAAKLKETGNVKILMVAGCLSQRYKETLKEEIPEIDAMIGTDNQYEVPQILKRALEGEFVSLFQRNDQTWLDTDLGEHLTHSAPYRYVKIAEGCNNHCAYCAIPFIRGNYRSKPMEKILREVENIVDKGTKEINFIAQDTTRYGLDLYNDYKLAELLEKAAQIAYKNNCWVRFLYGYPTRINKNLLSVIKQYDNICSYLDIPLQHINDKVLKRMNRGGNANQIKNLITWIKDEIPDVILRSSFIVGFPGETRKAFQELLDFLSEVKFEHAGIFKYSQEEDTKAYYYQDSISEAEKEERYLKAWQHQQNITKQKNKALVGSKMRVLIEEEMADEPGTMIARGMRHAPEVDGSVVIPGCRALPGDFTDVKIIQSLDYDLIGEIDYELGKQNHHS